MNRLFIVGNGFDLAHGLPTSYSDFLKYFWQNVQFDLGKLVFVHPDLGIDFKKVFSFYDIRDRVTDPNLMFYCKINYDDLSITSDVYGKIVYFKNDFFRILNQLNNDIGWVDIEDLYYKILKSRIKKESTLNYDRSVKELNEEFAEVKNLFEKYLFEEVISKYNFQEFENVREWKKMYNILRRISVFNNERNVKQEFQNEEDVKLIDTVLKRESLGGDQSNNNESYFLCFNYTPTLENYIKKLNGEDEDYYSVNYIHGEINSVKNPINFGFGDEMDDDYKSIENENQNEYTTNFKSFQYLQNSNYKNFLRFINSDKFQVCILGHSCGLSDRVLLNTIFEHPNCRSIKVYYYQNGDTDNFKDIIQNISRHFKDKKLMRELLVEKSLSFPLPQAARYQKES